MEQFGMKYGSKRTVEKEKFLSRFFEVVIDICQK